MTLDEFLAKLFALYPQSNKTAVTWIEAYKTVLKDPNIDFDELYTTMISQYSGASAPSPAWCLTNSKLKKTYNNDLKSIEYGTIWADKNGISYCYGIEPDVGFIGTKKKLISAGFTNLRNHEEYLKEKSGA